MHSGRVAITASRSLTAAMPVATSTPASAPASLPTFSGVETHNPVNSNWGLVTSSVNARRPTFPVPTWATRIAMTVLPSLDASAQIFLDASPGHEIGPRWRCATGYAWNLVAKALAWSRRWNVCATRAEVVGGEVHPLGNDAAVGYVGIMRGEIHPVRADRVLDGAHLNGLRLIQRSDDNLRLAEDVHRPHIGRSEQHDRSDVACYRRVQRFREGSRIDVRWYRIRDGR